MANSGIRTPMPFCPICFRYLTPAQARAHSKHARVIRWPKTVTVVKKPKPKK